MLNTIISKFRHRFVPLLLSSGVVAILLVGAGVYATQAFAASGGAPITGYAWSSNIGWISFSGTTAGGATYGVQENKTTRALSGYAYSSNLGWISFNTSDAQHSAPSVNATTGTITGYARSCAAFANKNSCSGALDPNSGSWDGWIALSGTAQNGVAYGWKQSSNCQWSGYAWGSTSIGAVSASGTNYGVKGTDLSLCQLLLPTATISANPLTIDTGQSTKLTWSSANATSCTAIQGNFSTGGKTSGTITTGKLSADTLYQISCTGSGGTTKSNIQLVTVRSLSVSLIANRSRVVKGDSVTLSWDATNVDSCTITRNSLLWKKLKASAKRTISSSAADTILSKTIYKFSCVNNSGASAGATQTVNIVPIFKGF